MEMRCSCGKFRAEVSGYPKRTPGRLVCYCDDCQGYLHHLRRGDLLDQNGGTEIIPVYPADIKIISGREYLKCTRFLEQGLFRFSTTCCSSPIGNTDPHRPWFGIVRRGVVIQDPNGVDNTLGPVRASIMGKYAKGTPPTGTPDKFDFKGFRTVMPFILKGILTRKVKPSPFFNADGTPVVPAHALSTEERTTARLAAAKG